MEKFYITFLKTIHSRLEIFNSQGMEACQENFNAPACNLKYKKRVLFGKPSSSVIQIYLPIDIYVHSHIYAVKLHIYILFGSG